MKLLNILKKVLGWVIVIPGGLAFISCVICFFAGIFGGLDFSSTRERIATTIIFAVCAVLYGSLSYLGIRLIRGPKKRRTAPKVLPAQKSAPVQTAQPIEEPKPEPVPAPEPIPEPKPKPVPVSKPKPSPEPPKPIPSAPKPAPYPPVCPWAEVPPLTEAIESGNVGMGTTSRHMSQGEIFIETSATDAVKYYSFADGTLVFVGRGATKCVDSGGYDGRMSYAPEAAPWSKEVEERTTRAIFTEGITSVGSGLLSSLKNLEELNLADSVTTLGYNQIRRVRIFRAGKNFKSFNGFMGSLTELKLPDGLVHFNYHNSGALPGVTGSTAKIQGLLDEKLAMEFAEEMRKLFRGVPNVAEKMVLIPAYNKLFAASTISSLNWNSKYRQNRYVPEEDLWNLHGLPKKGHYDPTPEITIEWNYGLHSFVLIAAMVHAALVSKPQELRCHLGLHRDWDDGMGRWWQAIFPHTALTIIKQDGTTIHVPKPKPDLKKIDRFHEELHAARETFPPEKLREFEGAFYQYTQDVNRGGLEPELAAANRGMILMDGHPVHHEVAARMVELRREDPCRRAKRPFEVAGPNRKSLFDEENPHFLLLTEAKLADTLGWGQAECFMVDTRSWQPYYIITQYDGTVVAQTWYEVKEPVTWAEVARYAPRDRKNELTLGEDHPWEKQVVHVATSKKHCTVSWRAARSGYYEADLRRKDGSLVLTHGVTRGPGDPSSKLIREKTLTSEDCASLSAFRVALKDAQIYKEYIVLKLWEFAHQSPKQKKPKSVNAEGAKKVQIYGHPSGHGTQIRIGKAKDTGEYFVEVTDDGYPNPGAGGGFNYKLPAGLIHNGKVNVSEILRFLQDKSVLELPSIPDNEIEIDLNQL